MIGFSIRPVKKRVSAETATKFHAIPTANISDCMSRMAAGGSRIRPMHSDGVLVGPAFTVKTRPGDNLLVHKALDMALPGDVIVVDAGGDLTNSIIGEIMASHARSRGIAGLVIDGAVWDDEAEQKVLANIVSGKGSDRSWVDKALKELGCEFET
jgi:regulator of RNase E activity RraA